jgi:hypothetical protein
MSNALSSHGTILRLGDGGSPEVFADVAEVLDIDGPGLSRNMHDATPHADNFEKVVPGGILHTEALTFRVNLVPTDPTHDSSTGLLEAIQTKREVNWQLVFPDTGATQFDFPGFVQNYKPMSPVDGILQAEISIKPSGDIVES